MTWTGDRQRHLEHQFHHQTQLVESAAANFTWVNQEVQANFTSSATRKAITISGTTPKPSPTG